MKISREPGIFATVVGISAVMTAGFSWLETGLGWLICGLLRLVLPQPQENERKTTVWVQGGFGLLIGAAGILAAQRAFPEKSAIPMITLGVSLLLWRSLNGRDDNGVLVGNALGLVLASLFGAILLFGLGDVRWDEMVWSTFELKHVLLTLLVTSIWWCAGQNRGNWGWFGGAATLSVGMSLLTGGILGNRLAATIEMPLYRTVQTIHVFGTNQRLEALAASGVLIGAFALLLQAGELMRNAKKVLAPEKSRKSWYGISCGMLLIIVSVYMALDEGIRAWTGTAFWVLMAIMTLGVVILKNKHKVLDK